MRRRCRVSCSKSTLFVYITAVALFTLCNLIAMLLITRGMRARDDEDGALVFRSADGDVLKEGGAMLVGNLLSGFEFRFNRTSYRTDGKRTYVIHDDVVVGEDYEARARDGHVTLATQCSVDRLHLLVEVASAWRAPMSVAVYVPGMDFYIAKVYIAYLRMCSPAVRANATFHFMYHRDMAPPADAASERPRQALPSCARIAEALPLLMRLRTPSFRRWWQQTLHPQNHLRNVARRGVMTPFHFLTDIDIMPVARLARNLDAFLGGATARACTKCVYVVPTYEMPEKLPVPRSKAELLERVNRKQGRPFHAKVFIHNQYATNHSLWERLPAPKHGLEAAYRISNYEFFYEPFYVAGDNVPLHDERFIGYGFTRNTQVFEMHLAGFQFWVLNPAFAVHRGVQNKRGRGAWRERQNILNRKHFARFKHDMAVKYRAPQAKARS